jgi:hypothetical protein
VMNGRFLVVSEFNKGEGQMPQKDGSKEIAFAMWLERDRVNQIIAKVTAKPDTVRTW